MAETGSKCPVCGTRNATMQHGPAVAGVDRCSCRRCGEFILMFLSEDLPQMLAGDGVKQAALSHWIRTENEASQHEPPDGHGRREVPCLSEGLVSSIVQNPHPNLREQADTYIRWIGDRTKVGGKYAEVDEFAIQAILGSATKEEFELVTSHLRETRLIDHGSRPGVFRDVKLLWAGWERYHELKRATSYSRKAFMAMQYGELELEEIVEKVFKPAVKETGFELAKLPDRPQPAGLIDDRLRVEIRTSRFLVADLTHENAGAYWEAGYAEGLGKPVIYTCEKTKFEEKKTHFDTNHHLTVLWDSEHPEHAANELKATIRATLPAEAKLTDEG